MAEQQPGGENPYASPRADADAYAPLKSPGLVNVLKAGFFGCLALSMLLVLVTLATIALAAVINGDMQYVPIGGIVAGGIGAAMVSFLGWQMLKSARARLRRGRDGGDAD